MPPLGRRPRPTRAASGRGRPEAGSSPGGPRRAQRTPCPRTRGCTPAGAQQRTGGAETPAALGRTVATGTCPVAFFVPGSTGIAAEALGNTVLTQFPEQDFGHHTVPSIVTVDRARQVATRIDAVAVTGRVPVVFSTVVDPDVRSILAGSQGFPVDLFGAHITQLESALRTPANLQPGRAHGLGDAIRRQTRMTAVEYAVEHDDGQSVRARERADLILVAASRGGKTSITMHLALQHGVRLANFPLVDEDFEHRSLPAPVAPHRGKCLGPTSHPIGSSHARQARRPATVYSSLAHSAATNCATRKRCTRSTASPTSAPPSCPSRRTRPRSSRPCSSTRSAAKRPATIGDTELLVPATGGTSSRARHVRPDVPVGSRAPKDDEAPKAVVRGRHGSMVVPASRHPAGTPLTGRVRSQETLPVASVAHYATSCSK